MFCTFHGARPLRPRTKPIKGNPIKLNINLLFFYPTSLSKALIFYSFFVLMAIESILLEDPKCTCLDEIYHKRVFLVYW